MISWLTTVAPQTSFSATSSSTGVRRNNPGAGASVTDTISSATTVSHNWSQTQTATEERRTLGGFNGGPQTSQSESGITLHVLGTTDSTSTASGLNKFGDSFTASSTVTIRSVFDVTTTQTTRAYSYRPTTTTQTQVESTVSTISESSTTTTTQTATASTITHGAQQTSQSNYTDTATVSGGTVATPIAATIVQADYSEILWAVGTSAATALTGGLSAASILATSATRTTLMPWTATTTAVAANSEETTAATLSEISASVACARPTTTNTTATIVSNYNVLPHLSTTQQQATTITQATTASTTFFSSEETTFTKSTQAQTLWTPTLLTATGFTRGSIFTASTTGSSTVTRQTQVLTCETSTYSYTDEVVAYSGSDSDGNYDGHVTYTWTASTYETTSQALTTFASKPQGVTTAIAAISRSRELKSGVVDSSGLVALGYSASITATFSEFLLPVSRGASSANPRNFTLLDTSGEPIASATVSGLSLTFRDTSSSSTATLETFGSAGLSAATMPSRSAINASGLGSSETIYESIPRGVYFSGSTTFSSAGATTSYSKASTSKPWIEAVSFVAPTNVSNGGDVFTWSVTRNSHAGLADLTQSAAYSAL